MRGSRLEFLGLVVFAYLAPPVLYLGGGATPWLLLAWVTIPEAVLVSWAVLTRDSTSDLLRMTPRTSRLAFGFAVLQGAGMLLGD